MKIGNDLESEYLLNDAYLWIMLLMGLSSGSLMATENKRFNVNCNCKWESIVLYDMHGCVSWKIRMHTTCMSVMFSVNLDIVDPCWGLSINPLCTWMFLLLNANVHMVRYVNYCWKES